MATDILKIKAFEYVLFKLLEWYKESFLSSEENDISTLKALKLLFFITSVDTFKDSTDTLLDSPFDNFVAMPYGHVESEIYDSIKKGEISNVEIDNKKTVIKNAEEILELDIKIKDKIDIAFRKLKEANPKLIRLSSFELVELSHKWFSWKKNYQIALQTSSFSSPIPTNEIKSEDKFYQI